MESSTQGQTAPDAASVLGRRIVVWGMTGSGKTTLAQRLGEVLGLGVVDLDAIRHERGWDSVGFDEFRERLETALDSYQQGWVVAGSYSRISDVYLSRADTLIWLDLPWRISFWRLLRRTLSRAVSKEPLYNPNGPRESWRMTFFSRQSILWWSISHHRAGTRSTRDRVAALPASIRAYEVRSARELKKLLGSAIPG